MNIHDNFLFEKKKNTEVEEGPCVPPKKYSRIYLVEKFT